MKTYLILIVAVLFLNSCAKKKLFNPKELKELAVFVVGNSFELVNEQNEVLTITVVDKIYDEHKGWEQGSLRPTKSDNFGYDLTLNFNGVESVGWLYASSYDYDGDCCNTWYQFGSSFDIAGCSTEGPVEVRNPQQSVTINGINYDDVRISRDYDEESEDTFSIFSGSAGIIYLKMCDDVFMKK